MIQDMDRVLAAVAILDPRKRPTISVINANGPWSNLGGSGDHGMPKMQRLCGKLSPLARMVSGVR